MNLPYILRKYFGGNLHLKRKWKARIGKGLKWLKIWKGYRCQILQKKKNKIKKSKKNQKKKITPLLSITVILSSYEHIVEKELWCESCGYLFYCSFYQVFSQFAWFSISNSFLALTLWPIIKTLIKDLLISDFGVWLH